MEISGLVEYERLFKLDLLHPATDEPVGVVFQIRSAGSKEAKAVLRRHIDENAELAQNGKTASHAVRERQEAEKAASYIASWDWGENEWQGEKPVLTMEKAAEILQAEGWIWAQVTKAATKIANFTQALEKDLKKP